MNDQQLSPDEHDDLRARLLSGAKRIKPVGAHRRAIVTTTVAVVLVAGLSAGAIGAANFLRMGDQVAPISTPTPRVSSSATPTPTPTPSLTPTASPTTNPAPVPTVAFDGDCESALSTDEASLLVGGDVESDPTLPVSDPAVLGGVACAWNRIGERWSAMGIAVYPFDVVPDSVRSLVGVVPECFSGCEYAERFGAALVYAWGSSADQVVDTVAIVGPRASVTPGIAASLPAGAWTEPDCETLRALIGTHLGRTDFTPYVGDAHPQGMGWEILAANGAATWCSLLGEGSESLMEQIEVLLGPGTSGVDPAALERAGAVRASVPGATEAWLVSYPDDPYTAVYAVTDGNVLAVTARFLDTTTIVDLTGAVLAQLD